MSDIALKPVMTVTNCVINLAQTGVRTFFPPVITLPFTVRVDNIFCKLEQNPKRNENNEFVWLSGPLESNS